MTVRIAINGFGRIGRNILRAIHESGRTDLTVVALNDLGDVETNAHLLRYDSVHGRFPGPVEVAEDFIDIGAGPIQVLSERDPARLPWTDFGIDVALECTGIFTAREKAAAHLEAGARAVLISAPGADSDLTVVYGVNHTALTPEHRIVSNASCTTNCLAPVASVLHEAIGIQSGFMTTVHAYTLDQPVLDTLHKDLRRARGAAGSMIPTSTGAARAVGLVLPALAGKLDGTAVRVPTANVSMVDLSFVAKRATSVDEINEAVASAAAGAMAGVLAYSEEPLVSVDFNHRPESSIVDAGQTAVVDGTLGRVLSWYDNEWGFRTGWAMLLPISATCDGAHATLQPTARGMTAFRSLDDIEVAGKRVLVRVDLNVPMREGAVGDATRIDRVAPTLKELAERGHESSSRRTSAGRRASSWRRCRSARLPSRSPARWGGSRCASCPIAWARKPRRPLRASRRARWRCWRTCASTRARRPTIPSSPMPSRASPISTSTTRSLPGTGPMRPPPLSRSACRARRGG